jgi:hypothetical protein
MVKGHAARQWAQALCVGSHMPARLCLPTINTYTCSSVPQRLQLRSPPIPCGCESGTYDLSGPQPRKDGRRATEPHARGARFTNPLFLPMFEIFDKVLQPDSELFVEDAVAQLVVLLPEGKPYSSEVGDFIGTCIEMADAIPYTHSSMLKLDSILDLCLHSERFPEKVGSAVFPHYDMLPTS